MNSAKWDFEDQPSGLSQKTQDIIWITSLWLWVLGLSGWAIWLGVTKHREWQEKRAAAIYQFVDSLPDGQYSVGTTDAINSPAEAPPAWMAVDSKAGIRVTIQGSDGQGLDLGDTNGNTRLETWESVTLTMPDGTTKKVAVLGRHITAFDEWLNTLIRHRNGTITQQELQQIAIDRVTRTLSPPKKKTDDTLTGSELLDKAAWDTVTGDDFF